MPTRPEEASVPPAPALIAVQDKSGVDADAGEQITSGPRTIDALMLAKRSWLNPTFFVIRVIVYFVVWSAMGLWYWRQSILQDETGDYPHHPETPAAERAAAGAAWA